MTKRDLIVAILCTFCLTATLFAIMPVNSVGTWDPWLDVVEDGRINVLDLILTAQSIGTAGSTTKNVTVVGRANKLAFTISDQNVVGTGSYITPWIELDGYSKFTVNLYTTALSNSYHLHTRHSVGGSYFIADKATNFGNDLVKTYDAPNQKVCIFFQNNDAIEKHVSIDVYLIP